MDADPTNPPQPDQPAPTAVPATPPAVAPPPVEPAIRRRHRLDRALEAADPAVPPPKPRKRLGRPPKGGDARGRSGVWHVYTPATDPAAMRLREQVEAHCKALGIPLSTWLKRAAATALARESAKSAVADESIRAAIAAAVADALAAERTKAKRRKGSRS